MPPKNYSRRNFFQKVANKDDGTTADPLFTRFSRKELGRKYSSYQAYLNRVDLENEERQALPELERVGVITSGLAPYTGAWTAWEAGYLLRRCSFGHNKAMVDNLLTMSMSDAVDAITTFSNTPANPSATPLNAYNTVAADPNIPAGDSWTSNNLSYASGMSSTHQTVNSYRFISIYQWQVGVWLNDNSGIREKMVNFWYHFIPINHTEIANMVVNTATLTNDYFSLLRNNAVGNFKTLIKAITKNPAMLIYLSNHYSTAAAPNENYARELLELFMIGKDPQNYTEDDVKAGAKVLSGWRVASFTAAYPFVSQFYASYHNQTSKVFSANFNNTVIPSPPSAAGPNELDALFDMIFSHQGTTVAKYICKRLYRYFVYYDIDSNIQTNVIDPLATVLINNNWEILPTLKTLLKSEHFYDMANRGVMIKSPFDLVMGMTKFFNVDLTPATSSTTPLYDQYRVWGYLHDRCKNDLDQGFALAPTVSGWKAYYQEPAFYQNWINANTILKRQNVNNLFLNGFTLYGKTFKANLIAFVQQWPNTEIQNPNTLIDNVIKLLLPLDLPSSYKLQLKQQALLNNQTNDSYWTNLWNQYTAAPTVTTNINSVTTKLKTLVSEIINLAEFQLS